MSVRMRVLERNRRGEGCREGRETEGEADQHKSTYAANYAGERTQELDRKEDIIDFSL